MRKLLEEAAKALGTVQHYFPSQEQGEAGTHEGLAVADVDACQRLLSRIDAALAALEPDAMEIVWKVRDANCPGEWVGPIEFDLTDTEAAALIEARDKRVPSVMLEDAAEIEAGLVEYYGEYTKLTDATKKAIVDKYGYRAE